LNRSDFLGLTDQWYGYNDRDFRDYVHKRKQEEGFRGDYDKEGLDRLNEEWKSEGCPRGKGGKSGKGGQSRVKGPKGIKALPVIEILQILRDVYDAQKRSEESGTDVFNTMTLDMLGIDATKCKADPCSCFPDLCL
jgi:hypothetical protein